MAPGLLPGDRLLVERRAAAAGDVVVVNDPRDTRMEFLKRIVGLPGDRVAFEDGRLLLDDAPVAEPYLRGLPQVLGLEAAEWSLGEAEYFVLGDNRAHTTDSRTFGPVDAARIVGRAWFRYWPLSKVGPVR